LKRVISFTIILVLIFSVSLNVFADMKDVLDDHWCNNEIEETFVEIYFPYLVENNYEKLDPDKPMEKDDFLSSFKLLLKDYGYTYKELKTENDMSRKNVAYIIAQELVYNKILQQNNEGKTPFKDLSNLTDEEKYSIYTLYDRGIMNGRSKDVFNPDGSVTQAECIILLQRVKGVLVSMRGIPFKIVSSYQSYNGSESVKVKEVEDKVEVTLIKTFPTPGYSMTVNKIVEEKEGVFRIELAVKPPKAGAVVPQVIVYNTIVIEIDKKDIGNPPYNFKVANGITETAFGKSKLVKY